MKPLFENNTVNVDSMKLIEDELTDSSAINNMLKITIQTVKYSTSLYNSFSKI